MRVLYLIPNITRGGIQTQVLSLGNYLMRERGFTVSIVGFHTKDESYLSLLKKIGFDVRFSPEIGERLTRYDSYSVVEKCVFWFDYIRFLKSFKPSVIAPYTQRIDDLTNAVWRFTGAKLSFSFERGGYLHPKREKLNWLRRLKKLSQPTYVANSNHGALALAKIRNIPIRKIHVIPNAYVIPDLSVSDHLPVEVDLSDKVVFIMLANFFDQKDHTFLLKAWQMSNMTESLLLLVGGGGTDKCRQNYHEAQEFVKNNGLDDQVFFLGATGATQHLLSIASIGLLTSRTEGCPNAVLEYMGAGLPVLARDIPGIREVLPEENKVILTGFDDIRGLARQMCFLEKNKALRIRLGEVNRQHVMAEFRPEEMFNAYNKLISAR
ncbi:hypothetical protein BFP97_08985 [Roseivirga sp. 4D4]|uniref:glycosyltransferase family 4 protein n=1 Tax=Roseivirga sp. 4D4 TaxID=1889784 RepID=UPI000852B709|nr:glycosyltransferase family 4 protein [Roseivirga sp. 4D4]OEK01639.1 hypothetical protein BFP97_08985 [Roseivirga sp. 4D4]